MKRNGKMLRSGVPVAGMRAKKFRGWRFSRWHEIRTVTGYNDNGLPIVHYEPAALIRDRATERRIAKGQV